MRQTPKSKHKRAGKYKPKPVVVASDNTYVASKPVIKDNTRAQLLHKSKNMKSTLKPPKQTSKADRAKATMSGGTARYLNSKKK